MANLFVQMSVALTASSKNAMGEWIAFAGDEAFDELLTSTVRGIDEIMSGAKRIS